MKGNTALLPAKEGGDIMLKRKQVLTMVSIAIISFLIGTMFNLTSIATGSSGSPWDRVWTAISELRSGADDLNASLLELETRVSELEAKSSGFLSEPAYDSGWIGPMPPPYDQDVTLKHNLGTEAVFVYMTGKNELGIHHIYYGDISGGGYGATWWNLNETHITFGVRQGYEIWEYIRVRIWKIHKPPA